MYRPKLSATASEMTYCVWWGVKLYSLIHSFHAYNL